MHDGDGWNMRGTLSNRRKMIKQHKKAELLSWTTPIKLFCIAIYLCMYDTLLLSIVHGTIMGVYVH